MACSKVHLPHVTSGRIESCGCRSGGILECVMPAYPADTSGFYRRRGHFVDQCCAILAQGKRLDAQTIATSRVMREKPLATDDKYERWCDYAYSFESWMQLHKIKYVASAMRVVNEIDGYIGEIDDLLIIDDYLTVVDLKCGSMPITTGLQTALYNIALGMKAKKRLGLLLTPDKCEEYWFNDYLDYNEAKVLTRAYHIRQKYLKG